MQPKKLKSSSLCATEHVKHLCWRRRDVLQIYWSRSAALQMLDYTAIDTRDLIWVTRRRHDRHIIMYSSPAINCIDAAATPPSFLRRYLLRTAKTKTKIPSSWWFLIPFSFIFFFRCHTQERTKTWLLDRCPMDGNRPSPWTVRLIS